MGSSELAGNALAGYRLIRKLAEGSRASVYLGSGSTGTVALKLFHSDVAGDSIGRELDALSRLDSPHLVRLVDVSSADDETPILVFERVQRGSILSLLRDRAALESGEVVTLLAPIAAALPSLHGLGVGHQNIGASAVHVGASGEPVLLGFGHCELFEREGSIAAIEAEPAAARDRDALASLAVSLLSRTRNAATERRTVELIEWIDAVDRDYEFPEELEARLFNIADPMPIEFARETAPVSAVPARLGIGDRAPSAPPQPVPTAPVEEPNGVHGWLAAFLAENPVEVAKTRVTSFVKGVRKPFWIAAVAVVLAFIVVLVVLPATPPQHVAATATPTSTRTPAAPVTTPHPVPADPVLALPILLGQRAACIRALSVLCLNDVDEVSSSAYNQDAELVEQLQGGSEIPSSAIINATAPVLVELLGASAIVSLGPKSDPASILMIRDEAGWRIRSYLTGIQATGSPAADSGGAGD